MNTRPVQSEPELVETNDELRYFGYTGKQLRTVIIFGFVNLFASTIYSLQAPFYPKEAESKGASATQYGFVLGVFQLVVFIMSPVYGSVLNLVNPRLMFIAGIVVTAACASLFGLLDYIYDHMTFITLSFVLRILQASGDAAFVTASFTIIALEFPKRVATTFATLETCWGLGLIVGPGLGGALYELGGFIFPFLFMGGCLIASALLTYFFLPELSPSANDEVENHIEETYKFTILSILRMPDVALAFFSVIITSSSSGFLMATLEHHLRENFGLTPTVTGLVFIIEGGMYALSAPIWGKCSDKSSQPKLYTIIGSLLTFSGFLFIGPAPFIPSPTLLWLTCLGLGIHGIGTGSTYVSAFLQALKGAVNNGFPDNLRTYGIVSGVYISSFALGSCVGPSIGGILLDNYGFKISSVFVLVIQCLTILLTSICISAPDRFKCKTKANIPLSGPVDDADIAALLMNKLSTVTSSTNCTTDFDNNDEPESTPDHESQNREVAVSHSDSNCKSTECKIMTEAIQQTCSK